jgi:hypothetical protein
MARIKLKGAVQPRMGKATSTNIQAPKNKQIPTSKTLARQICRRWKAMARQAGARAIRNGPLWSGNGDRKPRGDLNGLPPNGTTMPPGFHRCKTVKDVCNQ